jgi:hypothetical protein
VNTRPRGSASLPVRDSTTSSFVHSLIFSGRVCFPPKLEREARFRLAVLSLSHTHARRFVRAFSFGCMQPHSSRTFTTLCATLIPSAKSAHTLPEGGRPRRLWWRRYGEASTWTKTAQLWTLRRCDRCDCKKETEPGQRRLRLHSRPLRRHSHNRQCPHTHQLHPPPSPSLPQVRSPRRSVSPPPPPRRRVPHRVFDGLTRRHSRRHNPRLHRQSLHQALEATPLRARLSDGGRRPPMLTLSRRLQGLDQLRSEEPILVLGTVVSGWHQGPLLQRRFRNRRPMVSEIQCRRQ